MATKANRFGVVQTRMRRGQVELAVWRDAHSGRFHRAPAGMRSWLQMKAEAARANLMEDRVGKRLMTREEADTRWYMIRGPKRWVPRGKVAGWHHGYYYVPNRPFPVVPPAAAWNLPGAQEARFTRKGLVAPPGVTMNSQVPNDVWQAAHLDRQELHGRRHLGPGADLSARSERYKRRRGRAGLSSHTEKERAKSVKVSKVGRGRR